MKKTGFLIGILLSAVVVQVHAVSYKTTILSNPSYDNAYAAAIDAGRIAGNCFDSTTSPPPVGGYTSPLITPMLWANSQSSSQPLSYGSYLGGFLKCVNGDTIGGGVSFVLNRAC
jgi:hypothetical protein